MAIVGPRCTSRAARAAVVDSERTVLDVARGCSARTAALLVTVRAEFVNVEDNMMVRKREVQLLSRAAAGGCAHLS